MLEGGRVLLICDDEEITRSLREKLTINCGFSTDAESSSQAGLAALRRDGFDVVIIKSGMPDLNTEELISGLKKIDLNCTVIAFIEQPDTESIKELFRLGIYDFFSKPVDYQRFSFTVKKGIELHSSLSANQRTTQGLKEHNLSLEKQNILLAKRIEEATKNLSRLYEDLRSTYMRTIKVLAQAIEVRDHYTHSHSENVAKYSVAIAEELGLTPKDIETIREACELHDLGKIGIEDSVLSKPGALNEQEWAQIKRHPEIGAKILEPLTFLNEVTELVRQHHEHYDGSGYPEGRKGEDIFLGARIIHIADAYESMRSVRSYRKIPLSKEAALKEIRDNSGTQFDPKIVEVFFRVAQRF